MGQRPAMNAELARLEKKGEDAKAKHEMLKEMKKVTLAQIALDWSAREKREEGKYPTNARAMNEAMVSPSYRTFLEGLEQAHREWGAAKAKAKQKDNDIWAARQAISFLKAEMQNT